MIRRWILWLLVVPCWPAWAEGDLEDIAARLSADPVIRARMHVSQSLQVLTKPVVSNGQILVDSNLGVIWKIDAPYQGTTLYPVEPDRSQSQTTRIVARFVSDIISTVMAGRFDELKGFLGIEETIVDEQGKFEIRMIPATDLLAGSVKSLTIEGGRHVETVYLVTGSGDSTMYTFSQHLAVEPKPSLSAYLPLE